MIAALLKLICKLLALVSHLIGCAPPPGPAGHVHFIIGPVTTKENKP